MKLKATLAAAAFGAFTCSVMCGPIAAQSHQPQSDAEIEHARRMMPEIDAFLAENPDNLDALYAKARASVALGLDADARDAYLRLLPLAPNHPVLLLELATVEHRLKQYESARSRYEAVAAMPDLPPAVSAAIDQRMTLIASALQRHFFSGSITLGLRAQENANGGPDNRFVDFWGINFQMDDDAMPQSDETATISGRLSYRYKLNDHGDMLGAQLSAFTIRPNTLEQNQRDGLELRFGPSLNLSRLDIDGTLTAQAVVTRTWVEGEAYMAGRGLQLGYNLVVDPQNRISMSFAHREEIYDTSARRPRAADRDGHRNEFGLSWQHLVSPDLMVTASYGREDRNAAVDYRSSVADLMSIGVSKRYESPVTWSEESWTSSARIEYKRMRFDGPDLMLDPTDPERTQEISISLMQSIPLNEEFSMNMGITAVRATSNYSTSEWSDKSIDFSISYSF